MSIAVLCPNLRCKAVLNVPETARGQVIRCGQCGTPLRIPSGKLQMDRAPQGASHESPPAQKFVKENP